MRMKRGLSMLYGICRAQAITGNLDYSSFVLSLAVALLAGLKASRMRDAGSAEMEFRCPWLPVVEREEQVWMH